jgi:hypothetical protein
MLCAMRGGLVYVQVRSHPWQLPMYVLLLSRQGAAHEDEKDAAFTGRIVSPEYKAVQVTPLVHIPWFQATYVVDIESPKRNACNSGKMLV